MKKFDVVSKRKIWLAIPMVLLIVAIIAFAIYAGIGKKFSRGLAVGVEFQGGTLLNVQLGNKVDSQYEQIKKDIEGIIVKEGGNVNYIQKSGSGNNKAVIFKYSTIAQAKNDAVIKNIKAKYSDEFATRGESMVSINFIGPSASSQLIVSALLSILISSLLIMLYIMIRFEMYSAIAAVIALLVDVLTMFCLMVIFHIQINSTFIAAIITVVAYSINNTIVIFDRIRENNKILDLSKYSQIDVINLSVKETMVRSITTTITTLFAIVIFAIVGVSAIKEFALPVIFGIVSGMFTSIATAPSLYYLISTKGEEFRAKRKKKRQSI